MKRQILAAILGLAAALGLIAENRTALLVAAGAYSHFAPLSNPIPESRELAATLRGLGFEVVLVEDAGRERTIEALADFEDMVRKRGGIAFFHFGGHGVQVGGKNYLIPADADIPDERRVATRAIDLDEVIGSLDAAGADTNIVIIDACRNNPLPAGGSRSATRGLAVVGSKPRNSIVVYSAESGTVARDGLFTPALTRALAVPGSSLQDALMAVRREVFERSGGEQVPGSYDQLFSKVYLAGEPPSAPSFSAPAVARPSGPPASRTSAAVSFIETSDVHGAILQTDPATGRPGPASLAKLATLLRQKRSETGGLVLLDCGDSLQGQASVYYYDFIRTDVPHIWSRALRGLGYDAVAVGNHDFEMGGEVYDRVYREAALPVLCANVSMTEPRSRFKPYAIIERGGLRIAVLGLTSPRLPYWLPG